MTNKSLQDKINRLLKEEEEKNAKVGDDYAGRLVVAIIWCILLGISTGSLAHIIFVLSLIPILFLLFMIFQSMWNP